ncbi:glucose-6-phosphatase catalytic subunit 1 [Condylostylus longicornis]|uniref:glucose-6-phosphatase catalytic subunit 1 n=1 Tax=Condylostylus longicornis TaxID=2530218 RepID=UPI00244E015A|nr:glucose-6-phosphatase catalytic subunit 1 [Condylostylus longicornis]
MLIYFQKSISSIYDGFLGHELSLVHSLQTKFEQLEPLFEFVSEELHPDVIATYVVPLLGLYSMDAMVKYLYGMGVIMLSTSVLKWIVHEDRPYWWCREKDLPSISQHRLTCETTSGIPSGHSAAIVALSYLILAYLSSGYRNLIYFPLGILCLIMFMSRIYFGCHFLHQCIIGGMIAYGGIKYILEPQMWQFLLETGKKFHIIILIATGLFTLWSYVIMMYTNIDPHWSVRMAFKWCRDPMYLSHTSSPVYSMLKDFGYMMGVALSAPLIKSASTEVNPYMSVPITLFILIANTFLKVYTPTQSGRFAFVSYAFFRSLFFTFSLLTIMPKLAMKGSLLSTKKAQ